MKNTQEQIWTADVLLIYGAHLTALECARWLIQTGVQNKFLGFAVTERKGNPEELLGFPVKTLEDYREQAQKALVLLALPEKYYEEAERYARDLGFRCFIRLGLEKMSELKGAYLLARQKKFPTLPFVLAEDVNDPSWLNMAEKEGQSGNDSLLAECVRHYKFPTLFYLEEEKLIKEALNMDFYKDYEQICGCYRNLHTLPVCRNPGKDERDLKNILKIFLAYSNWDSKRAGTIQSAPWICPIQVGCSLSGRTKGELFDDAGDNISQYNGLFAEMTGAYWIWKNEAFSEYKGLCHYRRHFIISEEEICALKQNDVDVILTTPRYVPSGIKRMFLAETPVKDEVFAVMCRAVAALYTEEETEFKNYVNSCFYYPNNMVIARNGIYDSYCSWMFPVLFYMQKSDLETGYGHEKDRHIAYAAEILTSYYFVKNKEKYHIAVTDYQYVL